MEANDENVREITPHQITPSKGLRAALGWLAEPADNPSGKETKNAY
jgi:hypothetical protein